MKISREKLVSMINESIRKQLLNEARSYAHDTYIPYEREILSNEEVEQDLGELQKIFDNEYNVTFEGNSWYEPAVNRFGYGDGCPASSGVDDIQVTDDGGFSADLQALAAVNPELAQRLKNDFDTWCGEHDEYNTEFEVDDDYPEWDD